jgi:hypothetical protein
MSSTSWKACEILLLSTLVFVRFEPTAWAQTNVDTYIENLSVSDGIAGLTANLNLIRTYRASFVVSDPNGKNALEQTIGWERVPGSGDGGIHDKRFYTSTPAQDSEAYKSERYSIIHGAFNGEKAFLCQTRKSGDRKSIHGEILPTLNATMVGLGLTLTTLSTHFMDSAPIQRVVTNGTFVKEGIETVNGHKCLAIYGECAYAEPGPWQVTHGPGQYVKLFLDPLSGFMPVRQEWYAVKDVEGRLVRNLFEAYSAEFKQCDGGIWFPVAGSSEGRTGTLVLRVKECSFNMDIPQEDFAITAWPPGTLIEDKVANITFTIPRPLPHELSDALDVNTVPDERAKQFAHIEEKLAAQGADIMAHDTHVPEAVLNTLEAKRPMRTLFNIRTYAMLGGICLVVGVAFFALGRLISQRNERTKKGLGV